MIIATAIAQLSQAIARTYIGFFMLAENEKSSAGPSHGSRRTRRPNGEVEIPDYVAHIRELLSRIIMVGATDVFGSWGPTEDPRRTRRPSSQYRMRAICRVRHVDNQCPPAAA
jgi:hypothetical protein